MVQQVSLDYYDKVLADSLASNTAIKSVGSDVVHVYPPPIISDVDDVATVTTGGDDDEGAVSDTGGSLGEAEDDEQQQQRPLPNDNAPVTGTVVPTRGGGGGAAADEEQQRAPPQAPLILGNLLTMLPSSNNGKSLSWHSGWMAEQVATLLAMRDFNDRKSSFIETRATTTTDDGEDATLSTDCNFYLTMNYRDSGFNPVFAAQQWQEEFITYNRSSKIRSMAVVGTSTSPVAATIGILGGTATVPLAPDTNENEMPILEEHHNLPALRDAVEAGGGEFDIRRILHSSEGIPNISPAATAAILDDPQQYPYLGRTIPSDIGDARALVAYLLSIGVKLITILHENDEYGVSYMLAFQEIASDHNITTKIVSYQQAQPQSLERASEQVRDSNTTYNFLVPAASNWESVVESLYDGSLMGVPEKMWFLSSAVNAFEHYRHVPNTPSEVRLARALNRTAVVQLMSPPPEMKVFEKRLSAFMRDDAAVEYFLSKHLSGPLYRRHRRGNYTAADFRREFHPLVPSPFSLNTYDAVMAFGLAACHAIATNSNTSQTIRGGDHNNRTSPSPLPPLFSGPELFATLTRLSFRGASGYVRFDHETGSRLRSTVGYQIRNVLVRSINDSTFRVESVDCVQTNATSNWSVTVLNPMVYSNGSTFPPPSLPPVDENLHLAPDSLRWFCWFLAAAVLSFAAYCCGWTIVRRAHPKVKASQPLFLVLLAVGAGIMGVAIIPTTFQEPMSRSSLNTGCMMIPWLWSSGLSIAFAALFSKTWRIYQVYANAQNFRRVVINARDVLWPLIVVCVCNLIVLASWTAVAPLKWTRTPITWDLYGRVTSSQGTCYNPRATASAAVFRVLLLGINLAALLVSNYQSFRARNLPSAYNESFYVGITNLMLLEGVVLGVPIYFLISKSPPITMVVQSLLIAVFSLAVLLPMFVPKFLKERDAARESRGDQGERRRMKTPFCPLRLAWKKCCRRVLSRAVVRPKHPEASGNSDRGAKTVSAVAKDKDEGSQLVDEPSASISGEEEETSGGSRAAAPALALLPEVKPKLASSLIVGSMNGSSEPNESSASPPPSPPSRGQESSSIDSRATLALALSEVKPKLASSLTVGSMDGFDETSSNTQQMFTIDDDNCC